MLEYTVYTRAFYNVSAHYTPRNWDTHCLSSITTPNHLFRSPACASYSFSKTQATFKYDNQHANKIWKYCVICQLNGDILTRTSVLESSSPVTK